MIHFIGKRKVFMNKKVRQVVAWIILIVMVLGIALTTVAYAL